MKTTIDIPDVLLGEMQDLARRRKTTFKELAHEAFRKLLAEKKGRKPFKLRDCSVKGEGLQPEFEGAGWDRILEAIYEDRSA